MNFIPDYNHIMNVMDNKRPKRLPLYEHIINPPIMEKILGVRFSELHGGNTADIKEYFIQYCRFFEKMTYDTVSYEICITDIISTRIIIIAI